MTSLARHAHWYNTGIDIMGVAKHFMVAFKSFTV